MRILRSLTDRLIGRVVPEVEAQAAWRWQYACNVGCGRWAWQKRQCREETGVCGPWQTIHCDC
jgi:hypothetical protein